jgi:lysophospholipase L1-like esterase
MRINISWRDLLPAGFAVALCLCMSTAVAQEADDWVGTWTASPQPVWAPDFLAPPKVPRNLWNQTVRELAHVSIGGSKIRLLLSNEYTNYPITIGSVHAAISEKGAAIVPATDRAVTFGGKPSITIPPGAPALSDPIDLIVPPLSDVTVSVFVPDVTPIETMHWEGRQTAYIVAGDKTTEQDIKPDSTMTAKVFLSEILVDAQPGARTVVTFGDSITDGDGSTIDANLRWPDNLAKRLSDRKIAVLNEGISGAKVLSDRMGVNALARFERDVLSQSHADSEEKEKVRQAVNKWIRESGAYDGVADFDAVVRDPANPKHIKAEFDSGDHLHPNDAGYVAMANSIDLGSLLGNKK